MTVLKMFVIKIVKVVVTFNMNPMLTKVTLNSFILAMAIFWTGLERNLGLLVLLHVISLVSVY